MKFHVLQNNKPAILPNSFLWSNHIYDTFDQAWQYANNWLGELYNNLPKSWNGDKYAFFTDGEGSREIIEIQKVEE